VSDLIASVLDQTTRSNLGATFSRIDKRAAKKAAKSHHASVRAERARKRKAKQARKCEPGNSGFDPRKANEQSVMAGLFALFATNKVAVTKGAKRQQ
jgi:hypothetical protein